MLHLLYFCAHWLLPVRDHGVLALERKAGPHCCQSIRPSARPSVRLAIEALSADKGAEFGWCVSDNRHGQSVSQSVQAQLWTI